MSFSISYHNSTVSMFFFSTFSTFQSFESLSTDFWPDFFNMIWNECVQVYTLFFSETVYECIFVLCVLGIEIYVLNCSFHRAKEKKAANNHNNRFSYLFLFVMLIFLICVARQVSKNWPTKYPILFIEIKIFLDRTQIDLIRVWIFSVHSTPNRIEREIIKEKKCDHSDERIR